MTDLEWSESFALGVPTLDDDHKRMFALANSVGAAISAGDRAECARAAAAFLDFAEAHFEREEAYLREIGFDAIDEHVDYHRVLSEKSRELKRMNHEGAAEAGVLESYRQIVAFLIDDILRGDFQFRDFLEAKRETE